MQLGQILDKRYKETKNPTAPSAKPRAKAGYSACPLNATPPKEGAKHLTHPSSLTSGHIPTLIPHKEAAPSSLSPREGASKGTYCLFPHPLNPRESSGSASRSSPKHLARAFPGSKSWPSPEGWGGNPFLSSLVSSTHLPLGPQAALHSPGACPHQGGLTCEKCRPGPHTVPLYSFSPPAPRSQGLRAEQRRWRQSRGTCIAGRSPSPPAT